MFPEMEEEEETVGESWGGGQHLDMEEQDQKRKRGLWEINEMRRILMVSSVSQ